MAAEKMFVVVSIYWGKEWTGDCYRETKGKGIHVTVAEHYSNVQNGGFSFRGCPLGRTDVH